VKDKIIIKAQFLQHVRNELDAKNKHNRKSIERIASSYGITDKSEVKEYTELAIVLKARSISLSSLTVEEKYWSIVELYKSQVNISHRTSQSILLQQYSTPLPFHFLPEFSLMQNKTFQCLNLPLEMVCLLLLPILPELLSMKLMS
jgi:hypothetical protein